MGFWSFLRVAGVLLLVVGMFMTVIFSLLLRHQAKAKTIFEKSPTPREELLGRLLVVGLYAVLLGLILASVWVFHDEVVGHQVHPVFDSPVLNPWL